MSGTEFSDAAADFDWMLSRTNGARRENGAWDLSVDSRLQQAAQWHCEDLADGGFLSHGSSDGRGLSERVEAVGYPWQRIGENVLCRTQTDAEGAWLQWWNSEGHRHNLLQAEFTQTGFGRAWSDKVSLWYYVMVLAAS